jgi:hypothetical protein
MLKLSLNRGQASFSVTAKIVRVCGKTKYRKRARRIALVTGQLNKVVERSGSVHDLE